MKPPLSPSYKFEKEEGGEGLEEEEGEAAPPAMIPGSATVQVVLADEQIGKLGEEAPQCPRRDLHGPWQPMDDEDQVSLFGVCTESSSAWS